MLLLLTSTNGFAQRTLGGKPRMTAEDIKQLDSLIPVYKMPYLDNRQLRKLGGFSKVITLEKPINLKESAYKKDIGDGYLYLYKFTSPNACGLEVHFIEFELPDGAELFVYNPSLEVLTRKYTSKRKFSRTLGLNIGMINDKELIIEYYEPKESVGKLVIDQVTHDFLLSCPWEWYDTTGSTKNRSSECYVVTAECASDNLYMQKKATVAIGRTDENDLNQFTGSGFLINNFNGVERKNYLVTAAHVLYSLEPDGVVNVGDELPLKFYFNREMVCGYSIADQDGNPYGYPTDVPITSSAIFTQAISPLTVQEFNEPQSIGATVVWKDPTVTQSGTGILPDDYGSQGDIAILELGNVPDDAYFAGWTTDLSTLESTYTFHHGYIASTSQPVVYRQYSESNQIPLSLTNSSSHVLTSPLEPFAPEKLIFKSVITNDSKVAPGGSGSPTFNQDGLMVGVYNASDYSTNPECTNENFGFYAYNWRKIKQFIENTPDIPNFFNGNTAMQPYTYTGLHMLDCS